MSDHAPTRFAQTKTARMARRRLALRLDGLDHDRGLWREVQGRVPEAWAWLAEDLDLPEERVKITLRLDKSVVAVFRAMGPGYTNAINQVLATYAQMQIGQVERSRPRVRVAEVPDAETNPPGVKEGASEFTRRGTALRARMERMLDDNRDAFIAEEAPSEKELRDWEERNGYWG